MLETSPARADTGDAQLQGRGHGQLEGPPRKHRWEEARGHIWDRGEPGKHCPALSL